MVTFSGIICTLLTLQLSEEQVQQCHWQDVLDISNIPRKRGFFDLIFSLRGWLCRPNPYGCLQPPRWNQNLHVWPVSARGWWENAQNNLAWCCLLSDPPGNCWHQPWHLGKGSISVEHCGHFGQAYLCFPLAGKFVCRECIVEILGFVKRVHDLNKWLVTRNMLWLMRKSSWILRSTNSDTPSWSPSTRCSKTVFIFNLALPSYGLRYICQFADFLTDFPMLDAGLQKGVGIYPGEGWCMPWCPHAKVPTPAFLNSLPLGI